MTCGVRAEDGGLLEVLTLSLRGILMVPALCATGTGAVAGVGAEAGTETAVGAGVGVDTGTGPDPVDVDAGSAGAMGIGLGRSFCFFFCCNSGSMEGDADVASSNFLFFEAFFSVFGVGVDVGVAMVLMRSRAFETDSGLNRFFRLEVIAPS